MSKDLLVSIVTYNSAVYIEKCLDSLTAQDTTNFSVLLVDNNSLDETNSIVHAWSLKNPSVDLTVKKLSQNMGFAAAHNYSAKICVDNSKYKGILILNPDVALSSNALRLFIDAINGANSKKLITPKLLRANESLKPIFPSVIDAAGMVINEDLRHFDRGSNSTDIYFKEEDVFGGTGACLCIPVDLISILSLEGKIYEDAKFNVFPALKDFKESRLGLFDEGFFAYREDADLCWRANLLNIKTRFMPSIVGYHVRKVLPSNRSILPSFINGRSVCNRFLLQVNNYYFLDSLKSLKSFLRGLILRNMIVLLGVLFIERTSLVYLIEFIKLLPRALERRSILISKIDLEKIDFII